MPTVTLCPKGQDTVTSRFRTVQIGISKAGNSIGLAVYASRTFSVTRIDFQYDGVDPTGNIRYIKFEQIDTARATGVTERPGTLSQNDASRSVGVTIGRRTDIVQISVDKCP